MCLLEMMVAKGPSPRGSYPLQEIATEAGRRLGARCNVRVTLSMANAPAVL